MLKLYKSLTAKEYKWCSILMADSSPWRELYFSKKQCLENLLDTSLEVYLAKFENKIVGFMALRLKGFEGEPLLEYICLRSEFRGKGLGKQLLEHFEDTICKESDNLYLFVSDINPKAILLYESIGYKRIGELENYNLWGQTEYIYRKFKRPRQVKFKNVNNLTQSQIEGNFLKTLDLNSGYPNYAISNELRECIVNTYSETYFADVDYEKSKIELNESVANLLKIPTNLRNNIRSTFSGSIALDRVFVAFFEYAKKKNPLKAGITIILPEPSIDLWQLLIHEKKGNRNNEINIVGVKHNLHDSKNRNLNLLNELKEQSYKNPNRHLFVIVDSPSNPLGFYLEKEEVVTLAQTCGAIDAYLIFDHCFLISGLHYPKILPSAFNISNELCDWIAVWDTGKTIDLGGDKSGFIISSNDEILDQVDTALAVIQPDTYLAKRSVKLFSQLFCSSFLPIYLECISAACKTNFIYLRDNLSKMWHVDLPQSGTFACIFYLGNEKNSDVLRNDFIKSGVNVTSGNVFFHSILEDNVYTFLRISLARDPKDFKNAVDKIINILH